MNTMDYREASVKYWKVRWRCGVTVASLVASTRLCTSGPVSTRTSDRLQRAYHPGIFTKLPRPTQPPTLSGTGNEYRTKGGDAVPLGSKAGWFIPHVDKRVCGR